MLDLTNTTDVIGPKLLQDMMRLAEIDPKQVKSLEIIVTGDDDQEARIKLE